MTIIEDSLDKLVMKIKEDTANKDVRFVKSYKSQQVDSPVKNYIVVASIDDLQVENDFIGELVGENMTGKEYKAVAHLKVYAPMNSNGNGLSELVHSLCTSIEKSDTDRLVEEVKMSSIEYDANLRTVYRTVTMTLGFCLCEEAYI